MTRTRRIALLTLALLPFGCDSTPAPSPAAPPSKSVPADAAPATPFTYHSRQILIPARINNVDVGLALIDTGATLCALDQSLAEKIGIQPDRKTEVHGTAGVIQTDLATMASVEVGARRIENLDATVYPLSIPGPAGEAVGLIIGYPFLRHFALDIDYVTHELRLHSAPSKIGASIPMTLPEQIPTLRATLNGNVEAEFRIDTGAALFDTPQVYFNITPTVLENLRQAGLAGGPVENFSGSGVGGPVELHVFQLARLQLGGASTTPGITLDQPRAIVQAPQGIFTDPATPGFIANYTLESQERVVIDYLDSTLDFPARSAP